MRRALARLSELLGQKGRALPSLVGGLAPLDLRILGRTLVQAALVGVACGLVGTAFFAGLKYLQHLTLERAAGYVPLRAAGEAFVPEAAHTVFHPWLLVLLPALGGLGCGLLMRFAPEIRGGGGNTMIRAFHEGAGVVRARVIPLKALASLFTLGTGGAGGREGPTMLIGAAIGSNVARMLGLSAREQRILLVAGVAGGISAVFRTPLGAALLAVEILYRDGFESDALIPAVLASVVSYSVVIMIFGESILLSHAPRFPFVPAHLPLYVLLALLVAVLALGFSRTLRAVRTFSLRLRMPDALRPALGGLVLGVFATLIVTALASVTGRVGQGLGVLGGGYGAAQMAVTGSAFLPSGWQGVQVLALLCLAKLLAASLTIGSGGSAGDFAPSLAMGALLGGAFGRAAQLLLGDPRIDPGSFALVGMGTFYGGIAHVPLSALVLVCELAGNYDLLVPLMLSLGIAFVGLRRHGLYDAQVATQRHSPVYRDSVLKDVLRGMRVSEVMRPPESGPPQAADSGGPAPTVQLDQDLLSASDLLVDRGGRAVVVLDQNGQVVGCLDETDVARAYLQKATRGPVTG